ncbi:MAG TPA: hypothetical protein ENN65_03645, partial [Candidatus Hydrogenedentes bacterium]|nr:hypothetical protein [Candidatus Hydrogenedentota bacterium]
MTRNLDAVRAMARELDMEPEHCFQVCATALSLFDQTRDLHELGDGERDLLEAAALPHQDQHRHAPARHGDRLRGGDMQPVQPVGDAQDGRKP